MHAIEFPSSQSKKTSLNFDLLNLLIPPMFPNEAEIIKIDPLYVWYRPE